MPAPATACLSATAVFSVVAPGGGPFTYQWQIEFAPSGSEAWTDLSNGPLPAGFRSTATAGGATTDTLIISGVDSAAAARYRCVVSNICGDFASPAATLTVDDCLVPGDMNCDGVFDILDVPPLALALTDSLAYEQQFQGCDPLNGDVNHDLTLDGRDIGLFVDCLINGDCHQPIGESTMKNLFFSLVIVAAIASSTTPAPPRSSAGLACPPRRCSTTS